MELCGQPLDEFVRANGTPGLRAIDVVYLGLQLCDAVYALHYRAGCVHLDIKPGNVMFALLEGEADDAPKTVKLIDLGLAKHLKGVDANMITRVGKESRVTGGGTFHCAHMFAKLAVACW